MAAFVWSFLYFLLPLSSLAGPLYTASLPSAIAPIPTCAQTCVGDFLSQEFSRSSCSSHGDLECFCTNDSASGLTLGEKAYLCLETEPGCVDQGKDEKLAKLAVYLICQNFPDARPMTHSTLTTTVVTLTTTVVLIENPSGLTSTTVVSRSMPTSSSRVASPRYPTPSVRSHTIHKPTSTTKTILSSTQVPRTPTLPSSGVSGTYSVTDTSSASVSTASSSIAAAAPTAPGKPTLAKSQIAGIVVGGVAGVAIALGLLFFICCHRRRRSNKRLSDLSFGNDKIVESHPDSLRTTPIGNENRERVEDIPSRLVPTKTATPEQGRSTTDFSRDQRPFDFVTPERNNATETTLVRGSLHSDEIGLALGSARLVTDETPPSAASYRTHSQLLPDKPSYSLFPLPLRVQTPRSPVSPASGPLLGEAGIGRIGPKPLSRPSPRLEHSPATSPIEVQHAFSTMHASTSDPFIDSYSGPRALTYGVPRRGPLRLETPSSSRPDPEILSHGQWTQSLDDLRQPVPSRHSSSARELNLQKAAHVPFSTNDYKDRHAVQPPMHRPSHRRRQGPRRMGSNRSRPSVTRDSSEADTIFEDTEDDEEVRPPMPPSYPLLPSFQSPGEIANSPIRGSAASQPLLRRPSPTSPTPQSSRRNQTQPIPLSAQNLSESRRNTATKPLPKVPEYSVPPGISTVRGPHENLSSSSPRNNMRAVDDVRTTAKWQILHGPGLHGIENPDTPLSQRSSRGKPATPSKAAASRLPVTPSERY